MRIVLSIVLGTLLAFLSGCSNANGKSHERVPKHVRIVYVEVEKKVDWDKFIEALIQIESEGDDKALNKKTDATGCLQLTPIYVKEVNRILGEKRYDLNDRYNRVKAIEMFNIMQGYYNPERDFHLALKIHNPRSKYSYHFAVLNKYNELINE